MLVTEKRCGKCQNLLPASSFNRKGAGLQSYCRECSKSVQQKYYHEGSYYLRNIIQNRYGITQSDYEDLLEKQAHRCATCKKKRKLVVDHDHQSGKVRGLLCDPCNITLGKVNDRVDTLQAMIRYLEENN